MKPILFQRLEALSELEDIKLTPADKSVIVQATMDRDSFFGLVIEPREKGNFAIARHEHDTEGITIYETPYTKLRMGHQGCVFAAQGTYESFMIERGERYDFMALRMREGNIW